MHCTRPVRLSRTWVRKIKTSQNLFFNAYHILICNATSYILYFSKEKIKDSIQQGVAVIKHYYTAPCHCLEYQMSHFHTYKCWGSNNCIGIAVGAKVFVVVVGFFRACILWNNPLTSGKLLLSKCQHFIRLSCGYIGSTDLIGTKPGIVI